MDFLETVIDHVGGIGGDDWCGVSTGEKRIITRIKRLQEKYPDEVECIAENSDGSVYYHVPWRWIKINPSRNISDEAMELLRKRFKTEGETEGE